LTKQDETSEAAPELESSRTGVTIEALKEGFTDHLLYSQGRPVELATVIDFYMALELVAKPHKRFMRFCNQL
jgi:hypothetical protein